MLSDCVAVSEMLSGVFVDAGAFTGAISGVLFCGFSGECAAVVCGTVVSF